MSKPGFWFVKSPLLLLSSLLFANSTQGQAPMTLVTPPESELYFYAAPPTKQLFSFGETIEITLELYSRSEQPFLVSRAFGDEFVSFKAVAPDGSEVPWKREARAGSKEYSPSDFAVLAQYQQISTSRIISLKNGVGFAFSKPGQYSLTAEFSMGTQGAFAPFEGPAKTPSGYFRSTVAFCIEACTLERLQVRSNTPRSALDAVRAFYTYITKYQQLGIPHGREEKALRPLLSRRLAQQLEGLAACDRDYYRRYGEELRANTLKPETPWLENGLFTGPNDAATPYTFRILSSRAIGENRVDVELGFTTDFDFEGVVTTILENNRWVIDDYVAMYENDDLSRLSAGYSGCKGGQWVGVTP